MRAADNTECIPIVTYVFVSKLGKILKYQKLANKEDGLTEAGSYASARIFFFSIVYTYLPTRKKNLQALFVWFRIERQI